MLQQFLPGFEGFMSFENASMNSILDVTKAVNYFESVGYDLLID